MKEAPPYIFIDESWIDIENKKHLIIGGLITREPGHLAEKVWHLKSELGLKPFDEIKWNSAHYTEEERNRLSDGMIRIIGECTGLISVVEGTDKQTAIEFFAGQVIDYCMKQEITNYLLAVDQGLIPRADRLREFITRPQPPACIGLNILDSRLDQNIQCTDVFVGFFRAAIRQKLGAPLKFIPNTDETFQDRIAWTLTEYVTLWTRGMLWGTIDELDHRGDVYYERPMHRAMGLGFRLHSSVSQAIQDRLEQDIATVYMGCLH